MSNPRKNNHPSESSEEETVSAWQIVLVGINSLNHVLIFLVTAYLVYLFRDLSNKGNQHALLCTIGYVFLMSEAIAALAGENLPTLCLGLRSSRHVHWILQVLGAVCVFAGITVKYLQKSEFEAKHFASTHSIIGLSSALGIVVVALSGLPALFAASLRKKIRPVYSRFLHNLLGTLCFVLGMLAQCYGYQKGTLTSLAPRMPTWLTVATGLILVFSLAGAVRQLRLQFCGVRSALRR